MKKPISGAFSFSGKRRVLCLITPYYLSVNMIREHAESLAMLSRHEWIFANAEPAWIVDGGSELAYHRLDFSGFDAVVVHYCSRTCFDDQFSPRTLAALRRFKGTKCLFIQDEYDNTARARDWIMDCGINHVFTVVPEQYIAKVYPPDLLPNVSFHNVLTGYVPIALERWGQVVPASLRRLCIAYRGRELPYRYGQLGREKLLIGIVVRKRCEDLGIPVDIEWSEDKRLYGRDWVGFLSSARATLCTESGSNVFDLDGSIDRAVSAAMKVNPALKYEDVAGKLFEEENLGVRMNQVPPKIFEFIAARTAIIAFEGTYSGVIEPDVHYFPLKKDFSNLDRILEQIQDTNAIDAMTKRAFDDVVRSGKYSWSAFVNRVDSVIERDCGGLVRRVGDVSSMPPSPPWYKGQVAQFNNERVAAGYRQIANWKATIQSREEAISRRQNTVAKLERKLERLILRLR